jgi:putative FmdB family regulatory protein
MPTYDYECARCHHRFEEWRSFSDNGDVKCPNCRGKTKRIFTSVPVIFKGAGFYITDHRKNVPAEDSAATATETKPETKKVEKVEAKKPE